jgi:hypothetical protein
MIFEDFIKNRKARISSKNTNLAKSLLKNSKKDLKFLETLEINDNSSRKIMVNYYETLRSILESITSLQGYKIYEHEAFTYYLKKINENALSIKFDRLRKIRNAINYYGEDISIEEVKEIKEDIKKIIEYLIKKYLLELK